MLALIISRFEKNDRIKWRSFGMRQATGTGIVIKVALEREAAQSLYYFKYLVESDENEERFWIPESNVTYIEENTEE